jgi:group I intron endonuclease
MSNLKNSFKFYYIYKTVNLINNKCYIGFHATNNEYDGYIGSGLLLKRAIKKEGIDNFISGILEYVTVENWRDRESYWIKEMGAHVSKGGYNLTWGGDGTLGLKFSEESRKKVSAVAKNRSNEHKEKIRRSILLKRKEINENISKSLKGKPIHPNTLRARQTAFLGKSHSRETKEKIGLMHKGKILSDETKQKLRDCNLGKKVSDETKKKISNSLKGIKRTPEQKEKYSKAKKGISRPTKKCPYCLREISVGNYSRWHGDKCKSNISNLF